MLCMMQGLRDGKSSDGSRALKRAKVYRPPSSFTSPSRAAQGQKLCTDNSEQPGSAEPGTSRS